MSYIPQRGHFIRLNFDPQAGHEQMGNRPALVASQDKFNQKMGFAFVCPISNTQRNNPFYVAIPEGEAVTGIIMTDQLRSEEIKEQIKEAIAFHLEGLREEGLPIPEPTSLCQYIEA